MDAKRDVLPVSLEPGNESGQHAHTNEIQYRAVPSTFCPPKKRRPKSVLNSCLKTCLTPCTHTETRMHKIVPRRPTWWHAAGQSR